MTFEQLEILFHELDSIGPGVRHRRALASDRITSDGQAVGQLLAIFQKLELAFAVEAKLCVQPFERRQIDVDLLRQLAVMTGGVGTHLLLVLIELLPRRVQLRSQELGRAGRFLGADVRVLVDIECRQRVGDVGNRFVVRARVTQFERDGRLAAAHLFRPVQLDIDVAAHLVQHGIHRSAGPQLRVEIETRDQIGEAIAAQDLLFDHVKPALELAVHGRAHEGLWNRPRHEDDRRRPEQVGKVHRKRHRRGHHRGGGENRHQLAPAKHLDGMGDERFVGRG